jgi:class 3 adenylate cyclase/tetratricopeptide (TPR) repeat protein
MKGRMDTDTVFLFPPFRLDVRNEQLWHGAQAMALRPKTFAVLRYMVARAGQLVTQDALLDAVWGPTALSETVVRSSIRELRTTLGDTAQHPRFIRTVHRRGYRFIAPVTVTDTPSPVLSPAMEPPRETALPTPAESNAATYPPTGPSLDEEYKLVTVLCCAVTDAPALAMHRGPEAMHRLMQAFLALAYEVMHRYGGTITHVTGEGFTAVFGAPVGQEDHARRAVLAALELSQRLRVQSLGEAHAIGMGLHTGPVVVGSLASAPQRLYTAMGDTLHQASRLQRLALPGTILLSAATHRLVQAEVRAEIADVSTLDVQGVPGPVYTVQELTQRRAGVSGQGTRHRSRFVGRERELALLHERLAHVAQGHGQVVGIAGEPGMGKSRLLAEFHRSLVGQPVTYREGHCLPYSSTTPYVPLRDLLRQGCGLTEADGVEAITTRIQQYLEDAQLRPEDEAPLLLQLLDVPVDDAWLARFSPQERKVRTFALLRHLVLHDSQRQPLVLAVENLHWVDSTSEEWLTALVEHLAGAAILLLVTHRPGYRPPWLAQSVATQMALPRLLPEDSRAVVQSVLQSTLLPEPLLQTIVTKAAGNPFFLEELAWAVIEQSPHPAVPGIPDTIQAVLAARIDRLPPAEKRLLQTAAVIGTEVAVPLLQAIAELPVEALHRGLAHLQAAEFLYETRLFPELVYTFKHALTHEVAYGSLLQERRRALHARIVEALETLYPARLAEQVERLAHHALRGEVWDKALMYCQQAGEKAMAGSAHHEAVGCFEQALGALQHLPEQHNTRAQAIDLRLALRSALRPIGDSGRALTYLREAEFLAMACDDARRLGQVSVFLSVHFYYMGAHDQAITAGQRALALATAGGDVVLQALANQYLGVAYQARGNYRQAIDCFGQTVAALDGGRRRERFGQIFLPAVLSRAWLACCHTELGMFAEGRALGAEGLQIAEAVAHPSSLMFAYWGVGLPSLRQGDLHRALPLLERAMSICQEADFSIFFPDMAPALGAAYTLAGRVADAVPLLTQAMEQTSAMDMQGLQALCGLPLGEAHMLAGRLEDAHALAERTLALARAHQERGNEAYALRLLGEIAARRDPPTVEQAEVHYQQALTLAEELCMRPLLAHCHLGLGTLYARSGRPEQACAALSAAVKLYRAIEMTFWLPQAEAALAQLFSPVA